MLRLPMVFLVMAAAAAVCGFGRLEGSWVSAVLESCANSRDSLPNGIC